MSDKKEFDLEAIVKIASSFAPNELEKFLTLVPENARETVLKRLGKGASETAAHNRPTINTVDFLGRDGANPVTMDEASGDEKITLPLTVIVEPQEPTEKIGDELVAKSGVTLVRVHARGAVGEVLVAHDEQLSRELAIKRIRPELPANERRVRRFIREAEITAKLQHPGIVPIYSLNVAGAGSHYSMPLVSGSTLSNLITETHRELGQRPGREEWKSKFRPLLTNFIAVCNAIGYAHSQKVLHRDIKPSNVIIGTQGQTLVLDWGCAKKIDEDDTIEGDAASLFGEGGVEDDEIAEIYGLDSSSDSINSNMTVAGSVMGTVQYMSPEQAAGDGSKVGTHSDIFGLGATLFNIITGDVAFDFQGTTPESVDKALEQVKRGEFRRVEELDSRVPLALAAICHRAMAVEPKDRYRTADELAHDVDAFLAGDQVFAYDEPLIDRATRFVRRHRTLFATLVGTLLVGFLSLALVTWMVNEQRGTLAGKNDELADKNDELADKNVELASVNKQLKTSIAAESRLKNEAVVNEKAKEQLLYELQMLLASEASSEPGGFGRMRQLVRQWNGPDDKAFQGWEWKHLKSLGRQELWRTKLNAAVNRILFTRESPHAVAFDSGGCAVAKIDVDGQKVLNRFKVSSGATTVDFNFDQTLMAVGFLNGTVKIYKTADRDAKPVELEKLKKAVTEVSWNGDGNLLATCDSSGDLVVWQWNDRKVVGTGKEVLNLSGKRLLCWSHDGKQICWTTGGEVRGLTIENEEEVVVVRDDWIVNPCWNHDEGLIGYIGPDNTIVYTNLATKTTSRLKGHQLFVESLSWHPTKNYLLSASVDGTVRIWNSDTEKQVRQLLGHTGHVYYAEWNPNGDKVVSGGLPEDPLHVWDVSNLGSMAFERELQNYPALSWHPSGAQLAVAENFDILIQNDLGESRWVRSKESNPQEIFGIDFNTKGEQIACVSRRGRIWSVDSQTGDLRKVYDQGSDQNLYPDITSKGVAWSPSGKYLAGVAGGGRVRVWDAATGEDVSQEIPPHQKARVIAWAPGESHQGSVLAIAGKDDNIIIFDAEKKSVTHRIMQHGWKTGMAWSPDGTKLAVANRRSISIWDTSLVPASSASRIGTCEGPSAMVWDLSWSKTQDRIAALTEDGKVCVWNAKSFAFCAKFKIHERAPYSIQWSPDGKRLVSTARHGRIVFQSIE